MGRHVDPITVAQRPLVLRVALSFVLGFLLCVL
jgi:hypothetical protein